MNDTVKRTYTVNSACTGAKTVNTSVNVALGPNGGTS